MNPLVSHPKNLNLKKFVKHALKTGKYKNLKPLPDGKYFRLYCVRKSNKNFTMENEDIFKDWDELKGRHYDRYRSRGRFLNALKGSIYFTVISEDNGSSYLCKFNDPDEIAAKKAKKKEKQRQSAGVCGTYGLDGESLEESPGTSCGSPPNATATSPSTIHSLQDTPQRMQTPGGNKYRSVESSPIALLGSVDLPVISMSVLCKSQGTAWIKQDRQNTAQSSPTLLTFSDAGLTDETVKIFPSVSNTEVNMSNCSNIPHSSEGHEINTNTRNKDLSKLVITRSNACFFNDMEVVPEKPDLNTQVFVGPSGNVFKTVPGSRTNPIHQFIPTDASTGSKNMSDLGTIPDVVPLPVNTGISTASSSLVPHVMDECVRSSYQKTPRESLPTASSIPIGPSGISTKNIIVNETFSELQVKQSSSHIDPLDNNPHEGTLLTFHSKEGASMDIEDESGDILGNRGWMSAVLTYKSSPLEAPVGRERSDVTLDLLRAPLFSENLHHILEKLPDLPFSEENVSQVAQRLCSFAGGTHNLSGCQLSDIQYISGQPQISEELIQVPHTKTHSEHNTMINVNNGLNGNMTNNEELGCASPSSNSQLSEMLFADATEICETEAMDDNSFEEINELMQSAYEKIFPVESVNCASLEAWDVPVSEKETFLGDNAGNVCTSSCQSQGCFLYVNDNAMMKTILEAISRTPVPVQQLSGDPNCDVNCSPLDNGAN